MVEPVTDSRPLRAYTLRDRTGYHEGCEVVFAPTAREARQHYLDGVEYIDRAARRAPEFDEYASPPRRVPVAARLAHGWFFPCQECGKERYEDDAPIIDEARGCVFCDAACEAAFRGSVRGLAFRDAEVAAARREATERFPGATVGVCMYLSRGYREPPPAEGYRIHVRLSWRIKGGGDVYASWSPGDGNALHDVSARVPEVRRG